MVGVVGVLHPHVRPGSCVYGGMLGGDTGHMHVLSRRLHHMTSCMRSCVRSCMKISACYCFCMITVCLLLPGCCLLLPATASV